MAEKFHILFCDDRDARHKEFRTHIQLALVEQLRREMEDSRNAGTACREYELEFHYSQSYPESGPSKIEGTKTVMGWLKKIRFDIVVTDMNFGGGIYGKEDEGLNIIENLSKEEHRPPWGTKFILITAWGSLLGETPIRQKYLNLLGQGAFGPNDWVEEIGGVSPWPSIRVLVRRYLDDVWEARSRHTSIHAPHLYDVQIIHKALPSNPIGVIVRERGPRGASCGFLLEAQSYTFQVLAENSPKFITNGQVASKANQLKANQ